MSEPTNKN